VIAGADGRGRRIMRAEQVTLKFYSYYLIDFALILRNTELMLLTLLFKNHTLGFLSKHWREEEQQW